MAQLVDDGSTSYVQANGAQEAIESGNTTSYPLTDALGSVRGVTDSSGTLTGSTSYDAFGAVRSQTGSSLSLGYTGQLTDPSTGFVDLRARQLDPTLGRFLSADSVQPNAPGTQGYNLYAYTANNPTTWTDLSGNSIGDPTAAASGTAMVGIFAMLLTSAVAGACIATAGWCLPFLVLGLGLSSTTGLLVATAVIVITFALIACALDAACQALTHRIGATVAKYGSAAVAGAWNGGPEDARNAAQAFPVVPAVHAIIDEYQHLTQRSSQSSRGSSGGSSGDKSKTVTRPGNGLGPPGVYPPGYDPNTWTVGPSSRPSWADAGQQSWRDPAGGEWSYDPGDRPGHSEGPHWDYKAPGSPNNPWQNIY